MNPKTPTELRKAIQLLESGNITGFQLAFPECERTLGELKARLAEHDSRMSVPPRPAKLHQAPDGTLCSCTFEDRRYGVGCI